MGAMNTQSPIRVAGASSIGKALELLDLVSLSDAGLSHAELAESSGLPRATVARLVSALMHYGLLVRRPGKGMCVGPRTQILADSAQRHAVLPSLVEPVLAWIQSEIEETTYFAEVRDEGLVYSASKECSRALRVNAGIGTRVILHASAIGQAYLACFSEERALEHLGPMPLSRHTSTTRTRRKAILEALRATQDRGVAITDAELDEGVTCFGVAVCLAGGFPVGGIGISMPSARHNRASGRRATRLLLEGKRRTEALIGGSRS